MSNSLENETYKLTKNGDSLILTNKKTQKTRVLEIDDANYVFDDNNHFRDSNIIENYFKLKEEQYTPTLQTKTADYKTEYKEAENLYISKYEDIIKRFIKKFNLSLDEIENLSKIPDDTTIKKFYRTEEQKKEIINSFKLMKKELKEDKKIETDPFTYLKSYFKDYYDTKKVIKFTDIPINDFIKNKEKYTTEEDYEKIKNKKIKSLDDLVKSGIKQFSNIDLLQLVKYLVKLSNIWTIVTNFNTNTISLKNINQPEYISKSLKYWWCITMNPQDGGITGGEKTEYTNLNDNNISDEKILFCLSIASRLFSTFYKTISNIYEEELESKKTITDFIYNLCEKKLEYFDSSVKISILENIYNRFEIKNIYDFIPKLYVNPNIEGDVLFTNFTEYKEQCPDASYLGNIYNKYMKKQKGKIKLFYLQPTYNEIKKIFDECLKNLTAMGNYSNSSSGWTDKTLTRIEKIKDTLKEVNNSSSGMCGMCETNFSSGWTDKTLTRIEKIKDTLKEVTNSSSGMCGMCETNFSSGWTDKTLTRIEKIKDTLKEVTNSSFGKINPSLLRVMNKTKSSNSNSSSGWSDTTLTRIEKIKDVLHNYI